MRLTLQTLPVLLPLITTSTAAQSQVLYELNGYFPGDSLGIAMCTLDDLDGDGSPDFAVGSLKTSTGLPYGCVRVFSGRTGSLLLTFDPDPALERFGRVMADAGDVDGDGVGDLVVGGRWDAVGHGARVFSGSDGSLLHSFGYGVAGLGNAVAGVGDVDQDGFADVAIAARESAGLSPRVRVYSGSDGAVLYTIDGEVHGSLFGHSLARLGDVNADGVDDLAVGAPGDSSHETAAGRASIHSGLDGAQLAECLGDAAWDAFGRIVRAAGDVDADGIPDLFVGTEVGLPTVSGYARVLSGADGSELYTFHGTHNWDYFGYTLSGAGDVDADGYADLAAGAANVEYPELDGGAVSIFSGRDGARIALFESDDPEAPFGIGTASLGDVDGDGYDDLAVAAINDDTAGESAGKVRVVSGRDPLLHPYCYANGEGPDCPCGNLDPHAGCASSSGYGAHCRAFGTTRESADDLSFVASNLFPGRAALLFAGTSQLGGGGGIAFGDGLRCAGADVVRLGVRTPNAEGHASWGPGLAAVGGWIAGDQRFFQVWYRDANAQGACGHGFNLSNGLAALYVP